MNAIVTFSGFTEDFRNSTGTEDLHRNVLTSWIDRQVVVYDLRFWDADTTGLASKIVRDGISNVVVVGYSWGAGYASINFAKKALKRGINVPLMCLCDPVYRPLWLPTFGPANIFGFRAMIPKSASIKIPKGIKRVISVRQTISLPQGHSLKHHNGTEIETSKLNAYSHTSIDSAPEWHAWVRKEIEATYG